MKTISPEHLRDVMTANPNAKQPELAGLLGMGFSTFSKKLKDEPALRAVYNELKGDRGSSPTVREGSEKESARSPRRKSTKQRAKFIPPPNNSRANDRGDRNGKGRMSDELLRRIKHEFEHVALYEEVGEHFQEVRDELNAIK